jgi:general secretion pathway protein K
MKPPIKSLIKSPMKSITKLITKPIAMLAPIPASSATPAVLAAWPQPSAQPRPLLRQRGAALLLAMLTVTLVATFASAALWQQWRSVEIESAQRQRVQLVWVLTGALDWARLILQEDARSSQIDHLSEPWALPLAEARLSSFLAMDKNNTDDAADAFLSGQISDAQASLNVRNLVEAGKRSESSYQAFGRLFKLLDLPTTELDALVQGLVAADQAAGAVPATPNLTPGAASGLTPSLLPSVANNVNPSSALSAPVAASPVPFKAQASGPVPLMPYRLEQLIWLGLSAQTVQALRPYVVLLPQKTPVNLNTASAKVIYALLPKLDMAMAQQMVQRRAAGNFASVALALEAVQLSTSGVDIASLSVASQYFMVRGRLRLDAIAVQEVSLVERQGGAVKVLWRQREVIQDAQTNAGSANAVSGAIAALSVANPSLQ